MKVLCQRERLRDGLSVVGSVIPQKSTRPAIENVYLAATDDGLELVGTDLEVAVRYRLGEDSKVEEPGTALIPARVAADFVRDLTGETVTLETQDEKCTILAGVDRCELVTADPDEFPVVPRFEAEGALSVQGGTFTRLVARTHFAAAREPGRYAMHGILTQLEDGLLRTVATDGRRLAVASYPIETDGAAPRRAIVPTKGMQLFARVIQDPLESVSLHFGEAQIGLRTKNAELFARLIDGEFPRYAAVIPTSVENSIEADAELMARKLRLVSNVTASDTKAVKLTFSKGEMNLAARSAGRGNASGQMEVDYKGKAAEIAFNPDYVLDGLKNCETDRVRLEFNEKTSPGKFTLGENYVYIVMPITIYT
jgi:DNA polymerase-3 subunit beta